MGEFVNLNNSNGAALLTVLVALLLISLMTLELQYTSLIERKLAYNDLNHLQANYLAKSGARLGLLRVVAYGRVLKKVGGNNSGAQQQLLSQIWSLPFPAFPPEQETLSKLSLKEKAEQEESMKETRISSGQFSYSIVSQSTKLNLNLLADPPAGSPGSGQRLDCRAPLSQVSSPGLRHVICHNLYSKIDELMKASEDPLTEFGNVRPQEIVDNIIDWISPTDNAFGASNKDAWYEQQNPPYKAKRGPFFTLDELKLVKDISPALYLKLQPVVTVFSEDGRIDLDQASQNRTLKTYFPDLREEEEKRIYNDFALRRGSWGNTDSFFTSLGSNSPYSASRYTPELKKSAFTIGSYNFVVRGKGVIKKSGSEIQKNIELAVSLSGGSSGCPEVAGVTDVVACTSQNGFIFADGKCYKEPTTVQQCQSCKDVPSNVDRTYLATGGQTDCTIRGTSNKNPANPYTIKLQGGNQTTTQPTFTSVVVYSWIES